MTIHFSDTYYFIDVCHSYSKPLYDAAQRLPRKSPERNVAMLEYYAKMKELQSKLPCYPNSGEPMKYRTKAERDTVWKKLKLDPKIYHATEGFSMGF